MGARLLVRVRSSLWLIPVLCVLAGAAIAAGTLELDRRLHYDALVGSPSAASAVLITMVVVQLAMGQFSPRIVQRILRDKQSQLAIGRRAGSPQVVRKPEVALLDVRALAPPDRQGVLDEQLELLDAARATV